MKPNSKTFEYGILDNNTDTLFLRKPNRFVLLGRTFHFRHFSPTQSSKRHRHNGRAGQRSWNYQAHRR